MPATPGKLPKGVRLSLNDELDLYADLPGLVLYIPISLAIRVSNPSPEVDEPENTRSLPGLAFTEGCVP